MPSPISSSSLTSSSASSSSAIDTSSLHISATDFLLSPCCVIHKPNRIVKKATTQAESFSGKELVKPKAAINPIRSFIFTPTERELLKVWGLEKLEAASRLPLDIQLPNATDPKTCTSEAITAFLEETTEQWKKRKAAGQGIPVNKLPNHKAYRLAMEALGLSSRSHDLASSFVVAKGPEEPISDNFSPQLALVPLLRVLCMPELSDAITFCFAFEGKILCKYGTYKIAKASYVCHLKVDLIDRESKNTITFMVNEVFVNEFVECFDVGDFVRIEGAYVQKKVWKDGGTSMWDLYANASTLLVKAKSFETCLHCYPEHRIPELLASKAAIAFAPTIAFTIVKIETLMRIDGGDNYRLAIVDGSALSDKASLLFVPTRHVNYHQMVDALKTKGSYSCVAHKIKVFNAAASTLLVVDATLICPLPKNLNSVFSQHSSKQVSSMGFEKKVFGALEIVNINSLEVEHVSSDIAILPSPDESTDDLETLDTLIHGLYSTEQVVNHNAYPKSVAPCEGFAPLSLFDEESCEELSFLALFFGTRRQYHLLAKKRYQSVVQWELKNADRRFANDIENLFFKTMKIVIAKVLESIWVRLHKGKLQDRQLQAKDIKLTTNVESLLSSQIGYSDFKSLRTSTYYKAKVKRNAFGMIFQLGPPTFFITLSCAE
ncbi:hypothetical protein L7F22_046830 [Adiantum nelumboides]|nr:hypothetical protein [Adiantum nelumboides]